MTKEERITIRLSPKLKKQLTVLQSNLYQSQRIDQEQGNRKEAKMLTISEIVRLVLTQAFNFPMDKIEIQTEEEEDEEPELLSEEEQVEERKQRELAEEVETELAELDAKGVSGGWNDDKLLNKEMVANEELEEIEACLSSYKRLIKESKKRALSVAEKKELKEAIRRINVVAKRDQAEKAKIERDYQGGRYSGKRRRRKSIEP